MIEELDNHNEATHVNVDETEEEVQGKCLALDDNLEFDADHIEIEEGDHVFMAMVHPVNPQHFVRASSMVSSDTTWAPYPRVDHSRLKVSDTYRSSYAKADDSQHVQSRRHYALHSTASNPRNAQCSQSAPPVTVSTLVSYVTYLSLIIFVIIPHPMTLLTAF
jgi:hypothetical protein